MAFNPTFANNEMRILRRLYARAGCYRIDCYSALVRGCRGRSASLVTKTLEYSLIHEMDDIPLVLDHKVSAPEELLILLNHAEGHRLPKDVLFKQAKNSTSTGLATALSRLLKSNEIRSVENGDIALTPKGQKRLIEEINPALTKRLRG